MKNIKKITALIELATLGISTANAGVYIGADVGYSKIHTGNINYTEKIGYTSGVINSSNKNKELTRIRFGYSFNNGISTEMALTRYGNTNNSYVNLITDTQIAKVAFNRSLKPRALMANAYYHFNTTSPLQPYVTTGIRVARNKTGFGLSLSNADFGITLLYNSNGTKNSLSYQAGTDALYKITDKLHADAGIKYVYLGESQTYSATLSQRTKMSSVDATMGIRYSL